MGRQMKSSMQNSAPLFKHPPHVRNTGPILCACSAERGQAHGKMNAERQAVAKCGKVMYNWTMWPSRRFGSQRSPNRRGQAYAVRNRQFISGNCSRRCARGSLCRRVDPSNRYLGRFTQVMITLGNSRGSRLQVPVRNQVRGGGALWGQCSDHAQSSQPESRHAMGLAIWGQA